MKYCNDYAALLDLFVDGELTPAEMVDVQAHLDTCPGCRAYVDAAFAMRAAFPDTEDTVVPAGFADAVMAAVRRSPRQGKRKTPWVKVLTPLAACCAIVILLQSGTFFRTQEDAGFFMAKSEAMMQADSAMISTAAEAGKSSATGGALADQVPMEAVMESSAAVPMAPGISADDAAEAPAVIYATVVYLTAEHMDLLPMQEPIAETAEELHYELSPEAAEELLTVATERSINCAIGHSAAPTTHLTLVVVRK